MRYKIKGSESQIDDLFKKESHDFFFTDNNSSTGNI